MTPEEHVSPGVKKLKEEIQKNNPICRRNR